ncbi:MAG: CsgG/HfaB family protein [Bacteroidota bacterium]
MPALSPARRPAPSPARGRARCAFSLAALSILALGLAACSGPVALPSVDDLRARVLENPTDVEALRDLGARLAIEGEYTPALGTLERADRMAPGHGETLYILGLVNEAMGDALGAERAYARYLNVPATDIYRDSLRGRLDGLVRARLRQEFASALATEDSVMTVTGTGAIGVLPFAYRGTDEQYVSLGRGLAEVLSIDLAAVESLTVVERARLQALLAEYELARRGVLDASTAPRAGRLLEADRLVGGEVDVQGENLRIESAVWEGVLQGIETTEGDVADLFRIQKEITLQVLATLGIEVTAAEEAAILEAPTEDLLAFLLYSRALLLEDDGDFIGASRLYSQAVQRDPGFALAARRQADTQLSASTSGPAAPRLNETATASIEPIEAASSDLIRERSDRLRASLGQHVPPGDEARQPAVEGGQSGILGGLPDPPDPPTAGGNNE